MHAHSIDHWRHHHAFLGAQHGRHERRAWFVVALTVTMMVVEIVGGHQVHHDTNFRAAYVHVLADALTSILAIVALLSARFYGWVWMDPAVGLIGAVVIAFWSLGLMRSAGRMLLDMVPNTELAGRIRERLEINDDRVSDLHVWQVGPGHSAVVASVVTHELEDASAYKARLKGLHGLSHVTIELHTCPGTHSGVR